MHVSLRSEPSQDQLDTGLWPITASEMRTKFKSRQAIMEAMEDGGPTWRVWPGVWLFFLDDQWIGLRENLQETMFFTIKYRGFL